MIINFYVSRAATALINNIECLKANKLGVRSYVITPHLKPTSIVEEGADMERLSEEPGERRSSLTTPLVLVTDSLVWEMVTFSNSRALSLTPLTTVRVCICVCGKVGA